MSFLNFFLYGTNFQHKKWLRSSYPQDKIEAAGKSTYDYSGKVTSSAYNPNIRWVDHVIRYETVDPKLRQQAQEKLNGLASATAVVGYSGIVGVGVSMYALCNGYTISGITGAATNLLLSVWSLTRSYEAQKELNAWNDSINTIAETRRNASNNFNKIQENKLGMKYFTSSEVKDVFHRTIDSLHGEFDKKMAEGDPEEMLSWLHSFIQHKNPFSNSSLKYAFNDEERIINPKAPAQGYRNRRDLNELVNKSSKIANQYTLFNAERIKKLKEAEDVMDVQTTALFTADAVADRWLDKRTSEKLSSCSNDAEAEKIKMERSQDAKNKTWVKVGAIMFLGAQQEKQKSRIHADYIYEVMADIPQKVSEIFHGYEDCKNSASYL